MTTVVVVVLDSLGIGGAKDAARFGSEGANTAASVLAAVDHLGLRTPRLDALGLRALAGSSKENQPGAFSGGAWPLEQRSAGCDTPTGHWELMGCVTDVAPPVFPDGFSKSMLGELADACGVDGWLANTVTNGMAVLDAYAEEHIASLRPIVYTSADSVLQIAAHEAHFGVDRLNRVCATARAVLDDRAARNNVAAVGRVISRPFTGANGSWVRTGNRHDWPVPPPGRTALDELKSQGLDVVAIGKIGDIFDHRGITMEHHPQANGVELDAACLHATVQALRARPNGLVFANLVGFDSLFGHLRDLHGYARHVAWFDEALGALMDALAPGDRMVLTADHGNDPAAPGCDHTRERVPALVWGPDIETTGVQPSVEMASLGGAVVRHLTGVDTDSPLTLR